MNKVNNENLGRKIYKKSDVKTFPIIKLKKEIEYIKLTCKLLYKTNKLNMDLSVNEEWLLDNNYQIINSFENILNNLKKENYKKLPSILFLENKYPRIYILSKLMLQENEILTDKIIIKYLNEYQKINNLKIDEIYNISIFLQIGIIDNIYENCKKIIVNEVEKYKANNLIERIIKNKKTSRIKWKSLNHKLYIYYLANKLKNIKKSEEYYSELKKQLKNKKISIKSLKRTVQIDLEKQAISMKNCILNLKNINDLNIINLFNEVSIVEKILKKDPAKVYEIMDDESKNYYRNEIKTISSKYNINEESVVKEALRLCQKNIKTVTEKDLINEYINNKFNKIKNEEEINKKEHIGYYIIDEGREELISKLINKKIKINNNSNIYIFTIYFISIFFTIIFSFIFKYYCILLFIPIINLVTKLVQTNMNKLTKNKIIPRINYNCNIPRKSMTIVVIPTLLRTKEDVIENFKKLEKYYLANKSNNLFFAILGDCTTSNKKYEKIDDEICKAGIEEVIKLNKKYGRIFNFVYRERVWCTSEKAYMGWERKRGLINQFNEYLITGKNEFRISTFNRIPDIKYVITLDQDTQLVINSAFKLIGAMDHILNKPELNKMNDTVIKGHAIIQPRIEVNLESKQKNKFTKLMVGKCCNDFYTNAVSDIYQDNFEEGIYTGKGIYNLQVFYKVLNNRIPENKVISHDLLEGSYLRAGLSSDIILLDDYPSNYLSYRKRIERWMRGDFQIIPWLKSRLNNLSKYKIKDNIYRNLNELFIFILLIIFYIKRDNDVQAIWMIYFANLLFDYSKIFIKLATIPDTAYIQIKTLLKSFYRMKISHNKLLEWTTAEQAEGEKISIKKYYKTMNFQVVFSIIVIIYSVIFKNIFLLILGFIWILTPKILYNLSKNKKKEEIISEDNKEYLIEIARKTWRYFKDNRINEIVIDNYQEDRNPEKSEITSSTNIGMQILSTISAYDLKIEENAIDNLKNILKTVENLKKWNGHLYNWYNLNKLEVVEPREISTVDSGNFVTTLYILKQFFIEQNEIELSNRVDKLIKKTDFSKLYNKEKKLFSIGYDCNKNELKKQCYDMLASESRQTSLVAIAKGDVELSHWKRLGRKLCKFYNICGLKSWGGTMFEYLMPSICFPDYKNSLINKSNKLIIYLNEGYSSPWGISESAYREKDKEGNYQYKTFGVPTAGMKRVLEGELVISPYSSFLALIYDKNNAIKNIKRLEKEGATGKYGYYESIDYTRNKEIIKTYMAHHQGMIISSINNCLNNNILQERMMKNPEMYGIKYLLQEEISKESMEKEKRKKYKKENVGDNSIFEKDFSTISYQKVENKITQTLS